MKRFTCKFSVNWEKKRYLLAYANKHSSCQMFILNYNIHLLRKNIFKSINKGLQWALICYTHLLICSFLPCRVLLPRGSGLGVLGFLPSSQLPATAHWSKREALLLSTTKMAAFLSQVRRERWGCCHPCCGCAIKPIMKSVFSLGGLQIFLKNMATNPETLFTEFRDAFELVCGQWKWRWTHHNGLSKSSAVGFLSSC